jgi:hypothetical protein
MKNNIKNKTGNFMNKIINDNLYKQPRTNILPNLYGYGFYGDCESKVLIYDDFSKIDLELVTEIKDLKKGDCVIDSNNNISKIECVVMTKVFPHKQTMVLMEEYPNLITTPYHPVWNNGKLILPHTEGEKMICNLKYTYNFILDKHHIMLIGNNDVPTIGYNFPPNKKKQFNCSFLSSNNAIINLKKHDPEGFERGIIILKNFKY